MSKQITQEDLTERERHWLDKGYVSTRIAAYKTKRHVATVLRAIANNELACIVDGRQKYVSVKSLVDWIGMDAAKSYGLIKESG